MRIRPSLLLCLALAGCEIARPRPAPPDLRVDDLRDNAIGLSAAEPPWRDLAQHTVFPESALASHPAPSPDGKRFAYASTEFGPNLQIALRDADGAAASQITRGPADSLFPKFSPDGKTLAYASNLGGNWDLYLTRLDAPLTATQITFEPHEDVAPSWSPDGRKIVYCTRIPDGVWQIVIVDVGSRLKTFLGPGVYPDWSPDPKDPWICFQSQPRSPGGRTGIRRVRPDGTGLAEIVGDKAHGWSAINPHFSPDGKWIAYATVQKSPESRVFGAPQKADDIWIVRSDGRLDTRLTDDLSPEWWPAWGGDRVFFISLRQGGQNVYSVLVKPLEESP